jgi:hypothetical protein
VVASSANDVIINCPFDQDYAATFHAMVFAILACGFRPRCARELDDGGQTRIDKIYGLIEECRYGIHDLSRTELDEANGLPRFNMPLELGLFLGAKRFGDKAQKTKRAVVLDTEAYRYQQFISDLAGIDIHAHGDDALRALRVARDWLANVSRRELPSAARVQRIYEAFAVQLPDIAAQLEFEPNRIPYVDYVRIVARWLVEAPEAVAEP